MSITPQLFKILKHNTLKIYNWLHYLDNAEVGLCANCLEGSMEGVKMAELKRLQDSLASITGRSKIGSTFQIIDSKKYIN